MNMKRIGEYPCADCDETEKAGYRCSLENNCAKLQYFETGKIPEGCPSPKGLKSK